MAANTPQSDALAVEEGPEAAARSTESSATEKRPGRANAAGRPVRKAKAAASAQRAKASKKSPVGSGTLPERVQEFLLTNPGPQKIGEIAQALFGADATQSHGNQVRAAAEALARRGDVEKDRQGQSVFYQAVTRTPEEREQEDAAMAPASDEG